MKAKEAIKEMLKKNSKTQQELANALGYARQSSIGNVIARGNLTVDMMCKICDVLGYDLTIRPKSLRGKKAEGSMYLEGLDTEEQS